MSLEQHTSIIKAQTFVPRDLFFLPIGGIDGDTMTLGNLASHVHRSDHYRQETARILDKPRTWWTYESRKIPKEYRETVGAHMLKVAIAAWKVVDGLIKWHLMRRENPPDELAKIWENMDSRMRIIQKAFFHDFQEWGNHPDLTPWQKTKEEQDRIEYEAVLEYARLFNDDLPLKMYLSMRDKNLENEILFNLDKMDATVMALNYERDVPECDVSEFFPYTFGKFSLPMMGEILQKLIDHKGDYPIDFFVQYDSLLYHGGHIGSWKREMDARMKYGNAWELMLKLERLKKEQWMEAI